MYYRVIVKNGKYEIVETAKRGLTTCDTREQAERSIARLPKLNQPETPEHEHALALKGIPTVKSLKSIDAKLAAIKAAEKIENGSEEL